MAALTFGNIAAGTEGFYAGMDLATRRRQTLRTEERDIAALEELRRKEALRQMQANAPVPEAVNTNDLLGIGQQPQMEVEQVPVTSTEPAVFTPDQARAAAQERLKTTPEIKPVPGAAPPPYGQMVPNPSADPLMLQRATEMAQLNKMKVDGINNTLKRTDLPPNIRRNLEQQRDMYQQRLDANNQVITRNQPTIDYGREGRNYQTQQQQQVPGADATAAIRNVIGREGGLANNPADRGGLTKYGISQRAYPNLDIQNLTAQQAAEIYKRDFWDAIKADQLDPVIREMAFDAAVNQGVSWTKTALEQAKGDPAVFLQLREQRYRDIVKNDPTQAQFLTGWLNRLAEFRQPGAAPVQVAAAPTPGAAPAAPAPAPGAVPTAPTAAPGAAPAQPPVPGPIAAASAPGVAPQGVRQTKETKSPTSYYLANADAITGDQKILGEQYQRVRGEAIRKFQMYQKAGMGAEAEAMRDQIVQLDQSFKNSSVLLQGMNGIYQLEFGNDPRAVSAVMSYYVGQPVAFQPRSDGNYNMWVNGKKVDRVMTKDEVRVAAREMFDEKFRAENVARQADFNKMRAKSVFEMMANRDKISAEMVKDIMVQREKGNWELKQEQSKQGWTAKPDTATGTIVLTPPPYMQQQGVPLYIFNPNNKETVSVDGISVPANAAVPILNLPSATQVARGR